MSALHKTLGWLGLPVLALTLPAITACYAPRIESCRGALGDFSGVSEVELTDARNDIGFFEGPPGGGASFRVSARTTSLVSCIAVHSELYNGTTLVHTLDTTVTADATSTDDQLTTTRLYHYRFGDRVRVTTLGTTVEIAIPTSRDAGRDAALIDAPTRDGGWISAGDAGPLDDAGPSDDASADDAGPEDAGPEDAGSDDAGAEDAGPEDAGAPDAG